MSLSADKKYDMNDSEKYTILPTMEHETLEIVLTGEVTKNNVSALAHDLIKIVTDANPHLVLIDVRSLKGRLGLAETYFQLRNAPLHSPRIHTAFVDNKEQAAFQSFLVTAGRNIGFRFKWFSDIEEARAWLNKNRNHNISSKE